MRKSMAKRILSRIRSLGDDLSFALGLLTRLPVPPARVYRASAAWAWPLVGALIGAIGAALGWAGLALGLPSGFAAVLVLGTGACLTGGLHEDGLADSADGLFGAQSKERRLEIMKDSRNGSYGILALVLVTLARWSAISVLLDGHNFAVIIAAASLSRVPMAVLMGLMPNARANGLSHSVGRPPALAMIAACMLGGAITLGLGLFPAAMILGVCATSLGLALYAKARIGGQTGDILGAAQQLADAAALGIGSALL